LIFPYPIWLWILLVVGSLIALFCFYVELQAYKIIIETSVTNEQIKGLNKKARILFKQHENNFNRIHPDSLGNK